MLGQSVFRTGLSKVGLPGAKEAINTLDPTIAVLLKDQGYATGQFGKNHFGDRDENLPTNHGFDDSSATPIISTPRRNRKTKIIPKIPNSEKNEYYLFLIDQFVSDKLSVVNYQW